MNVSFAMNYAFGGLDVVGYHVVNIAIHLLCALVIFGIVRRTLESPCIPIGLRSVRAEFALAVAVVWAVHPLTTEVVDYLTQRTESLMALCYLFVLYASIRAARGRRRLWSALAIASSALGMGCKETMVTAPLMVVAYDWAFVYESLADALRSRARLYAGLAATWLVLAGLVATGPRAHSAGFSSPTSAWTYLVSQPNALARYLWLTVSPKSLVVNYGPTRLLPLRDELAAGVLIVFLLSATGVALARRRQLGFLGLWVALTLAPTSSVVPIATEVAAERRMYLPLAAIVVLGALGWRSLWNAAGPDRHKARRSVMVGAIYGVAIAFAAGSVARNREYRSALTLAQTVLERRPSSIAHLMVGTELIASGDSAGGVPHLREAAGEMPKARYALGVELLKEGQPKEAIEQLHRFVDEEPSSIESMTARHLIGSALATDHRWPEAIAQYRQILAMAPGSVDAAGGLADALFGQQAFAAAIPPYREYLKFRPDDVAALGKMGIALAGAGQLDEAVVAFRRVVEIDPRNPGARRNLTIALLDRRDIDEAVRQAQAGVGIEPDSSRAHDLLGRTLAMRNQLDEARAEFERALQLNPHDAQAADDLSKLPRVRRVAVAAARTSPER